MARIWKFGGVAFRTQGDVISHIQAIAAKYDIGDVLDSADFALMYDVLLRHPRADEKIGCGIDWIGITRIEAYGWKNKVFQLFRFDGTITDFSWRKCLRVKPVDHASYVKDAFRRVVASDVAEYKRVYFDRFANDNGDVRCEVTGLWVSYTRSHVDHVKPFRILMDEYLKAAGVSYDDVEVIGFGDGQSVKLPKDAMLAGNWRRWHKDNAVLRIVADAENMKPRPVQMELI